MQRLNPMSVPEDHRPWIHGSHRAFRGATTPKSCADVEIGARLTTLFTTEPDGPNGGRNQVSALVVDDDDFTRVLLVRTLESTNVGAVTQASDAASAMRLADTERPSLAIVDLDLGPGPNGIDLAHGLRRLIPTIAIIILSSYQDPRLVGSTRPMPLGAIYVSKRSVGDTRVLEEAVAEVMTSPLAERASPSQAATGGRKLSDNQVEIMRLVAEGYSNAEIARRRSLTEAAVAKAVARLVKQLGLVTGEHDNVRVLITQAYYELIGSSRVRRD